MASFHHLLPSSLWTNTRAQGRDLSEVHNLQRKGNCVAARLLKSQIHYTFWLAELAELRDAAIVLLWNSTEQKGLLSNCDNFGEVHNQSWKRDKSKCVPFITGLFILVNIKQKQQQNQERTSSHSCDYRFSYIDKIIYNGCHQHDMIMSASKKYGNEPFLWISSTCNIRLHPTPVMPLVLVQLLLKSVMTGILSELSLYVIMW